MSCPQQPCQTYTVVVVFIFGLFAGGPFLFWKPVNRTYTRQLYKNAVKNAKVVIWLQLVNQN
jgi:hypothetical protein